MALRGRDETITKNLVIFNGLINFTSALGKKERRKKIKRREKQIIPSLANAKMTLMLVISQAYWSSVTTAYIQLNLNVMLEPEFNHQNIDAEICV